MIKKVLAFVLVLVMMFGIVPTAAIAESADYPVLTVGGIRRCSH